uniref:O-methyltransferase domain-containing protein n=1 Tax=Chromera velia CCMP2878 TaxID=1169474 RepID=A0A0G4IAK3_9ALVE|eukprot:Cvel_12575.t1-p1 / transcript=Cvel_12575.t1 / gene=Cvel_12575 / organism=Chromera_velia_CCMP2878 / gene_product=hypothetical protein / transcript_product=hypothetical protein / location=Cvel_scaffold828:16031-23179(+) / protein_length=357 / sequence_SO=supercontig / SO=protein_coding / is_pseudo=false
MVLKSFLSLAALATCLSLSNAVSLSRRGTALTGEDSNSVPVLVGHLEGLYYKFDTEEKKIQSEMEEKKKEFTDIIEAATIEDAKVLAQAEMNKELQELSDEASKQASYKEVVAAVLKKITFGEWTAEGNMKKIYKEESRDSVPSPAPLVAASVSVDVSVDASLIAEAKATFLRDGPKVYRAGTLEFPDIRDNTDCISAFGDLPLSSFKAPEGKKKLLLVDVGGGKFSSAKDWMAKYFPHIYMEVVDPFNVPEEENKKVWAGSWPMRGTGTPSRDVRDPSDRPDLSSLSEEERNKFGVFQANSWACAFLPLVEAQFGKGNAFCDNNGNQIVAFKGKAAKGLIRERREPKGQSPKHCHL